MRIIVFSDEFLIKSDIRNSLTDDVNAACVALKNTKYSPNIKLLSSATQQKVVLISLSHPITLNMF